MSTLWQSLDEARPLKPPCSMTSLVDVRRLRRKAGLAQRRPKLLVEVSDRGVSVARAVDVHCSDDLFRELSAALRDNFTRFLKRVDEERLPIRATAFPEDDGFAWPHRDGLNWPRLAVG